MRRQSPQLSLNCQGIEHDHAKELAMIDAILSGHPRIKELVEQDLLAGLSCPEIGAPGMSGDQVFRALIIKQMNGFSYSELAFHLADSITYRTFCGYGAFDEVPSRSTLAKNIKRVRQETIEEVNRVLVDHARTEGIERGRKVRVDSTVVESHIHAPSDSWLLWDGVRVLTRLMEQLREAGVEFSSSDHRKRAKRRYLAAHRAAGQAERKRAYRDLLKVTHRTVHYTRQALEALREQADLSDAFDRAWEIAEELRHFVELVERVVDQTERRVLRDQKVPAQEKVVSLFEPHTDVIVKDRRDTLYGHKIFLTAGASGLITDCVIEEGNPADANLTIPMLERQRQLYGQPPRQASLDGGFASSDNLNRAKAMGVQDVCFAKKRGLEISQMARSTWVYKRLRDFRAGIEGLISFLKRVFGLARCTWRGAASFGSYVMASVVTANLLIMARHMLC
jgi:IS5 family transposase